MAGFAIDTVRQAARSPGLWILLALGLFAGWIGLSLAVLALGQAGRQAPDIVRTTAQLMSALTVFWCLARLLEEDRASSLVRATDAARPGRAGRLAGRWIGAAILGLLMGGLLELALGWFASHALASTHFGRAGANYLYITSICSVAVVALLAASWAVALETWRLGGAVVLLGLFAWMLGHLPWGSPRLLPGFVGRLAGAALPRSLDPTAPAGTWFSFVAASVGLLLLALASKQATSAAG